MTTEKRKTNFELFTYELCTGGIAAAISKTAVAPLERIKLILQTQKIVKVAEKDKFKGVIDAFVRIIFSIAYNDIL